MSKHNGAAATSPLHLFSPEGRVALMAQLINKRTTTKVELGGVEIDLLPLSTIEGLSCVRYLKRFGELSQKQSAGQLQIVEMTDVIGSDGRDVMMIMMKYLARCIGLRLGYRGKPVDSGDEVELGELYIDDQPERPVFEEWFAQLPLVEMLTAIGPKLLEANGMASIMRPTTAAPADAAVQTTPTP